MKKLYIRVSFIIFVLFLTNPLFAQISISATRAHYFTEKEGFFPPNEYGIYPVQLLLTDPEHTDTSSYIIYRSENPEEEFESIFETNQGQTLFFDKTTSKPETYYYYKVYNPLTDEYSETVTGWGALTYERYFITYNKVVIGTHKRLTLMNKPNNMDKIGKEKIEGLVNGTLSYRTKVQLSTLSGIVIMHYEQYSDNPKWTLTGNMDVKANIAGRGSMNNHVDIKGMYPGTVYYDNVLIRNSKAGGGTYGVQPENMPRVELDYEWTFVEVD